VLYDYADLRIRLKNGEAAWPRSRLRRLCFHESAAGTGTKRWPRRASAGQKTITGDFGRLDRTTWNTLTAILEQPLPALIA